MRAEERCSSWKDKKEKAETLHVAMAYIGGFKDFLYSLFQTSVFFTLVVEPHLVATYLEQNEVHRVNKPEAGYFFSFVESLTSQGYAKRNLP